jgi:hypothetical protein
MMLRLRVTCDSAMVNDSRSLINEITYPIASRQTSVRDSAPLGIGPSGMHAWAYMLTGNASVSINLID